MAKQPFSLELKIQYKTYRNLLSTVIKNAKIVYYSNKLKINSSDPKKFWRTIKEATNDNKYQHNNIHDVISSDGAIISDKKLIATEFNNYFSKIGNEISSAVNNVE